MDLGRRILGGSVYRAFAAFAILVFLVAPACSLICQSQSCHTSESPERAANCHQSDGAIPSTSAIKAATANCGSADLLFALPDSQHGISGGSQSIASTRADSLWSSFPTRGFGVVYNRMVSSPSPQWRSDFLPSLLLPSLIALRI
jgi:hypothetical protein